MDRNAGSPDREPERPAVSGDGDDGRRLTDRQRELLDRLTAGLTGEAAIRLAEYVDSLAHGEGDRDDGRG